MNKEIKEDIKPTTLSTGQYTIEVGNGPSHIFRFDEESNKHWVCSTTDPNQAMQIVEGLVLVEMKRFYYPESNPVINPEEKDKPVPPFLKRN